MKKLLFLILMACLVSACGGGSGSNVPAPAVELQSGGISRMAVTGTSVAIYVTVKPNFSVGNAFYAKAADQAGVFTAAGSSAKANSDGSYTLTLSLSSSVSPGHYAGSVTLSLYSDPAFATPLQVPSMVVPFDVLVMSPLISWPGDNLSALTPWAGVPDWSMFQGNAAHTGYVPVALNPNLFSARWRRSGMAWTSSFYPIPATLTAAGGKFFIAGNNFLYARNEFDGSLAWSYDFSGLQFPSVNPPAVAEGTVYMAAGQQSSTYFFAFNALDGTLRFKAPMSSQWENYLAPTISPEGVYTNAGTYGGLYAFSTTGQQLYFNNMDQTSIWTPAVDTTGVYTYTGGIMRVVEPKSGAVLHSITDPTFQNYVYQNGGSPVLGAPGSVFAANYVNARLSGGGIGNMLINFKTGTDSIAWLVPGNYPFTPAYAAGVVYAANEKPVQLEARAEADGTLLWTWIPPQSGDTNFNSEVLLTNNLVFVATNLATYAIDRATHQTIWSYPQSGRLALSQNGILYIQGSDFLTAINVK